MNKQIKSSDILKIKEDFAIKSGGPKHKDLLALKPKLKSLPPDVQKQRLYWMGFYNIEFFSDFFLPHWKTYKGDKIKTPGFHKEIWNSLTSDKNSNTIIARGHGKSTSCRIWILWANLYKFKEFILYISTLSECEKCVNILRDEFTNNQKIIEFFGNLTPYELGTQKEKQGTKWRNKEITLLNGTVIQTMTKGQSVRGKRPDKIIFDDPQENKEVKNKKLVDEFNTWVFTSLYNTMLPGNTMSVLGTIIGSECLVKYLRDEKKWHTVEYKAITNGVPIWGDMWSIESLEERKREIGTANFNQEFMNIPLSNEDAIVSNDWILEKPFPGLYDRIIMGVDPAVSEKESADFTGITIIGERKGEKFVLYSKGIKKSPEKLINKIIELYKEFGVDKVIYEKNIETYIINVLKEHGIVIEGVRAVKDKFTRLLNVTPEIETGKVFFKKDEQDELIYQLTTFPDVAHDDVMDSFVWALHGLQSLGPKIYMF